jgi:hypothetical protein
MKLNKCRKDYKEMEYTLGQGHCVKKGGARNHPQNDPWGVVNSARKKKKFNLKKT